MAQMERPASEAEVPVGTSVFVDTDYDDAHAALLLSMKDIPTAPVEVVEVPPAPIPPVLGNGAFAAPAAPEAQLSQRSTGAPPAAVAASAPGGSFLMEESAPALTPE